MQPRKNWIAVSVPVDELRALRELQRQTSAAMCSRRSRALLSPPMPPIA